MTPKARRLGVLLLIAAVMVLLPRPLAAALAIPRAASWISLSNLGILLATDRLGWRWGMASALTLTGLTTLAVLSQGQPPAAIPLMAISALALGLTARWEIQSLLVLLMVTQCFVVVESPVPAYPAAVLAFAGLLTLLTTATAAATAGAERLGGWRPPAHGRAPQLCTVAGLWTAAGEHHDHHQRDRPGGALGPDGGLADADAPDGDAAPRPRFLAPFPA